MKRKIFGKAKNIGWLIIFMSFILIYFWYFFAYIPTRKSDLTMRAFRILKEYVINMEGKYDYFKTHFDNYGIYYTTHHFENLSKIITKDSSDINYKNIRKVNHDLFSYVKVDEGEPNNTIFFSDKVNQTFLNFSDDNFKTGSIQKILDVYSLEEKPGKIEELIINKKFYQVPVDKFMEGLKFDEIFENIVLFDKSKVYFNSNPLSLADITNPAPLCDTVLNSQGGVYIELHIRGAEKHAMIIPVDFAGKRLFIAGLINDNEFKRITQTINNQILMLIAGLLLLVFVGMPVLKTMFIGPKERLKARDVSGSAISILFGSALFVLIVISIIKFQFVDRKTLSERIESVSDTLFSHVETEINELKKLGFLIAERNTSSGNPLVDSVIGKFGIRKHFFQSADLNTPFPLNEIILINQKGIVQNAYTRTAFSDAVPVNLSQRSYFKNAADNVNNPGNPYFIESIQSYNTGKGETAISFPTTKYPGANVLAITAKIPSLYKQVLPKDIHFVVIDKTGLVLYHSQKSKNLHENFLEECEFDSGILNAMKLRLTDKFRIKYNEKKWLARIVPLNDSLFHLTLLDLTQTDNKNARIFLITFYFMFGLQLFTILGLVLLRFTFRPKNDQSGVFRFFKRIAFLPEKYDSYKGLLIILLFIAAAGISSFVIQANLVNVLLLQFLSVGFTFSASLLFLKRSNITAKDYFKGKYFPENLIFIVLVLIIIALIAVILKNRTDYTIVIPLVILLLTVFIIPFVNKYFKRENNEVKMQSVHMQRAKTAYLAILFLWLSIFSVIPVIHSYFSVKHFEEKLWQQQQLLKIADDNLLLTESASDMNLPWFKRIQGNGIDGINVSWISTGKDSALHEVRHRNVLTTSEYIYSWLPDPIKNGYSHRDLLVAKKQNNGWHLNDNSLCYPARGLNGEIEVVANEKSQKEFDYFLIVTIAFLLVATLIWHLVKFAATFFLGVNSEIVIKQELPWLKYLNETTNKRILLKSFNGDLFLSETLRSETISNNKSNRVEPITAARLCESDFDCGEFLEKTSGRIWISRLDECIPEIGKHKLLLDVLTRLNHSDSNTIVVDLPFELELVNEYYDDYIGENELTPAELSDIYILKRRWNIVFSDYVSYNGHIQQVKNDEYDNLLPMETISAYCQNQNPEWCESNIWKNLTNYEKIVLHDLADDGIMNRNNKEIIAQLRGKKLILFNPFPTLFSPAFRDFIYGHISRKEVQIIEERLGLKGSWKNAKYFILAIIIPLAIFIFISQGLTIEKSFGIFAGIVGAITTLLKLFETNQVSGK